jgi:hypothetical protein
MVAIQISPSDCLYFYTVTSTRPEENPFQERQPSVHGILQHIHDGKPDVAIQDSGPVALKKLNGLDHPDRKDFPIESRQT